MSLKDSIKSLIARDIRTRDILSLDIYARVNHTLIRMLYDLRVIDDGSINDSLKKSIELTARQDLNLILNKGYYPDHVASPECLSYAIVNGVLSKDEIGQISFDHGQTKEEFCRAYSPQWLLDNLKNKFLDPPSSRCSSVDQDDFDPAC